MRVFPRLATARGCTFSRAWYLLHSSSGIKEAAGFSSELWLVYCVIFLCCDWPNSVTPTNLPNKVCIQPLSLVSLLSEWKCLVIAPIIPGTPAIVSSITIRLENQTKKKNAGFLKYGFFCWSVFNCWACALRYSVYDEQVYLLEPAVFVKFHEAIQWQYVKCPPQGLDTFECKLWIERDTKT